MNRFSLKPFGAMALPIFAAARLAPISPYSPELSRRRAKKFARPRQAPPIFALRIESGCRGSSEVQTKPSQADPSLLASIHKKTLAAFSGYSADSIAAAAPLGHPPPQEIRPPASNWLCVSFPFCLFYARNINVAPL
jgi:hypothetical protein